MARLHPATFLLIALLAPGSGCKVPLTDINAFFDIADAAWFAEEETLFVFYEAVAEQGIGPESLIEIRYSTDDEVVDWTELDTLPQVHPHEAVDCGRQRSCGSGSLHVTSEPRNVELRLRYHRQGTVSLVASSTFNVVGPGPPHRHRSLLVYGVFDETNRALQWRARHRFPTIRNEEATRLGLRRRFIVDEQRYGDAGLDASANPYLYGAACPDALPGLAFTTLETQERAIFNVEDLPDAASASPHVCARSTVFDPTGELQTTAVARKNPEVRPAFPLLRSPIRDAVPIKYLLSTCERTLSSKHLAMQRQRLKLGAEEPICIDGWEDRDLAEELVVRFRDDIERVRQQGRDMVLAIALHHDTPGIEAELEAALKRTFRGEQARNTPRVAGAFILDSYAYPIASGEVGRVTMWCPSDTPDADDIIDGVTEGASDAADDDGPPDSETETPEPSEGEGEGEAGKDEGAPPEPLDPSEQCVLAGVGLPGGEVPIPGDPIADAGDANTSLASLPCAILLDDPNFSFGPFSLGALPIFPSRSLFLDFVDIYSEAQAGEIKSLKFRVPELPPAAEHVRLPPFGVATFFNNEVITADRDDAFSYCQSDEYGGFLFRSDLSPGLLPVQSLPEWHHLACEGSYELGMVWDFPFLLRIEFEAIAAIAVSAFSASLPFGIPVDTEADYGGQLWLDDEFPLAKTLAHCRRHCDHPTFDAASVYQVTADFRTAYSATCFEPAYPERGDSGFPLDP